MTKKTLSENEFRALEILASEGGSVLVSKVPDRNYRDVVFGNVTPGHSVYRKLERNGFVFYTEEESLMLPGEPLNGFQFTAEIYLTDAGRAILADKYLYYIKGSAVMILGKTNDGTY